MFDSEVTPLEKNSTMGDKNTINIGKSAKADFFIHFKRKCSVSSTRNESRFTLSTKSSIRSEIVSFDKGIVPISFADFSPMHQAWYRFQQHCGFCKFEEFGI